MAGKREKPEDIVLKLRQVEVLQGQGKSVSEAVRQIGVTVQTYYRWRKEYGGMNRDQLKRLKEPETENTRLRRAVSDLTLDKMILAEAARGSRHRTASQFCLDIALKQSLEPEAGEGARAITFQLAEVSVTGPMARATHLFSCRSFWPVGSRWSSRRPASAANSRWSPSR